MQSFSTKEKVINIIEEIAFSWDMVAYQLDFTPAHVNMIQRNTANYPNPSARACLEMLQDWLESNHNATWAILTRAIRFSSESLTSLANDIEEALK